MELKAVRSDLTQDELPHSVLEGLVGGFLGAVVFETTGGEGETGQDLHLDVDIDGEEDAESCCHTTRCKDSGEISRTRRTNCRIPYLASPPRVCPAVDL